jgi:hypothetical protein
MATRKLLKESDFKFISEGLVVKTIDSTIVVTHLQFPGKRNYFRIRMLRMHTQNFLRNNLISSILPIL